MNAEYIDMINSAPLEQSRDRRRIKAEAIADILRNSPSENAYAETNHMFIKTFFDVVLEDFHNVHVVVLRRDFVLVLKSFIELGYFSRRNPLSYSWMSSPNAATAVLPAIAPDSALDQFDLCIAYLLDIEARAERFKRDYPSVPQHEVSLDQLNQTAFVEDLFDKLQLVPTVGTQELCGRVINERQRRKETIDNPVTLAECRRRLALYVDKARARGIAVPGLEAA